MSESTNTGDTSDSADAANDAYHKITAPPATKPQGCPYNASFTPFGEQYLADPYGELQALQAQTPIFFSEQLGYLVVTGMDNVVTVLKNHTLFSSENVQDPVFPVCEEARNIMSAADYNPQAVMSNCQQPDHTRIRKFTREGFNARRMKQLEPYIQATAEQLIQRMKVQGNEAEFVSSFAHPLPGQVIFRFIGFPEADDQQLVDWTANRLTFTWGKPTDAEQVEIARNMLKYWRYCRNFVATRLEAPGDDFTSELLAAHRANPESLSLREVESVIYGLSFAGHEIVSNFISLAVLNFQAKAGCWQRLCDDPSLVAGALEEVLRFDSPQTSWRRVATQDTSLNGVDIPKGTRIFVSLGSANRDAEVFVGPSQFDIDRDNAGKHVSFGHGIHFCLGARLARLEGEIALRALLEQLPGLRVIPDQKLEYSPNMTFRGPLRLAVGW